MSWQTAKKAGSGSHIKGSSGKGKLHPKFASKLGGEEVLSKDQLLFEYYYSLVRGNERTLTEVALPSVTLVELKKLCDALSTNTHVVSLGLSGKITSEGAAYVANVLKENDSIRNLAIPSAGIEPEGAGIIASALFLSSLNSLILTGNHVGSAGATSLAAALKQTKGLVALSLSGNGVDDIGLEALALLLRQGTAELQWLSLDHNRFTISGIKSLVANLRINRTLRHLNLSNCKLGPPEIKQIANCIGGINGNDVLEFLGLGGCRVDDNSVRAIKNMLSRSQSISALNLSACFLTKDHAQVLSIGFASSSKLSNLFLSHNRLDDEAVNFIVDALLDPECKSAIRRLDLSYNLFGRQGVLRLAELIASRLWDAPDESSGELGSTSVASTLVDTRSTTTSATVLAAVTASAATAATEAAAAAAAAGDPNRLTTSTDPDDSVGPLFELIDVSECLELRKEKESSLMEWFRAIHRCLTRQDPLLRCAPPPQRSIER